MSTTDNTLLGRCIAAYDDGRCAAGLIQLATGDLPPNERTRRTGVASVLDQLAAEIAVMLERNPNLTPHQLITILRMEAAGELAGWEQDPA